EDRSAVALLHALHAAARLVDPASLRAFHIGCNRAIPSLSPQSLSRDRRPSLRFIIDSRRPSPCGGNQEERSSRGSCRRQQVRIEPNVRFIFGTAVGIHKELLRVILIFVGKTRSFYTLQRRALHI